MIAFWLHQLLSISPDSRNRGSRLAQYLHTFAAKRPEGEVRSPPAGDPLGDDEAESLAHAMAAFSTASRLKLLYALVGIEQTVDGLASATSLGATVVSQQLRLLPR